MIIFTNPGLIDLRMLSTFGVNVKPNANAFGQFGTGLKYAVAVIVREGGTLELFVGQPYDIEMSDTKYTFGKVTETVRGEQFEFITLTEPNPDAGEEATKALPFTTSYGKNWEPWQAFRELWSNCMDEGGEVFWVADHPTDGLGEGDGWEGPPEDATTFIWSGELAEKVWKERGSILLGQRDAFPGELAGPLAKLAGIEVWPGQSEYLYLHGIRVGKLPGDSKSTFTYNLTGGWMLTEDRTLMHAWMAPNRIGLAVMQCDDAMMITKLLTTGGWELRIEWDEIDGQPSETFLQISVKLHEQDKLSGSAKKLFKKYAESYHSYGVRGPDVVDLSAVEAKLLQDGIELAMHHRVPMEGWSFGAQRNMDEDERFIVNGWSSTIYLNVEHLLKGPEFIARSIIVAFASIAYAAQDRDDRRGSGRADQLAHFIMTGKFNGWPKEPEPKEAEDGETGWVDPPEPPDDSRFETSGPIG